VDYTSDGTLTQDLAIRNEEKKGFPVIAGKIIEKKDPFDGDSIASHINTATWR